MNWRWLVGGSAGGGGRRSRGVTGTCQPARGVRRDTGLAGDVLLRGEPRPPGAPPAAGARGLRRFHRFPPRCLRLLPDATAWTEIFKLKNKIRFQGSFQQRGPCWWLDHKALGLGIFFFLLPGFIWL